MSIINNMPNKSGMDINGIEKEYYVYKEETVNAGDFVETIQGIKETRSTDSVSSTIASVGTYGVATCTKIIVLNENVFVAVVSESSWSTYNRRFITYQYKDGALTVLSKTDSLSASASMTVVKVGEHTLLAMSEGHKLTAISLSEDFKTMTIGSTKTISAGSKSYGFYGHIYIPLTDNSGALIYGTNPSGSSFAIGYCFLTFSGTTITITNQTSSLTNSSGTAYTGEFYCTETPSKIQEGKYFYCDSYHTWLITVDNTNKKVYCDNFTKTGTYVTPVVNHIFDGNKMVCGAYNSYNDNYQYSLCEIDINALTFTEITESVNGGTSINGVTRAYGNYVYLFSRYNPNNSSNTMFNINVLEIVGDKLICYNKVTAFNNGNASPDPCYFEGKHIISDYQASGYDARVHVTSIVIPEMQVKTTTVENGSLGVAKTTGTGGDSSNHNEKVTVIVPNI